MGLNDGKTKFLKPEQVISHFQLDANQQLSELEKKHNNFSRFSIVSAREDFEVLWQEILHGQNVGIGNWDKVLKRAYGIATRVDTDILEQRALSDLYEFPWLANRIFHYFAKRNRASQLKELFTEFCSSNTNLFEATEAAFFESVLLLDLQPHLLGDFLTMARQFAKGSFNKQTGRPLGRSSAVIVLYWLNESIEAMKTIFQHEEAIKLPKEVARSWIVCSTALDKDSIQEVRVRLFGHQSDDVARLSRFLTDLLVGNIPNLGNYKSLKSRWPLKGKYYDTRAWLMIDLASHSHNNDLKMRLSNDLKSFSKYARTIQEQEIVKRVSSKLV